MKNPILKSIIRRPIKFILLILILSLVSGAFIMNFTSYTIVSKEVESAKKDYNSIGYIQVDLSDGGDGNVYDIRELIKDEPMLAYEDYNKNILGISDNLLNADYNANTEYYNESLPGNYLFVRDLFVIVKPKKIRPIKAAKDKYDGVVLESHVQELLAGYPDWIYMPDGKMFRDRDFNLVASKYNIITGDLIPHITDMIIYELYDLETGANYLFRCEPTGLSDYSYSVKPLYNGGPLYEKIDNIGNFNLDGPKWEKMKDDMELLDINARSFDMIPTKNMETLPRTQESFGHYDLFDGRWINYDDHRRNKKVCVVGKHFFDVRRLKLGDKIPIKYMESELHSYLGTKKDRKEWKNYDKSDLIEYEIVGVYDDRSSGKMIYVPASTVPEEFMDFPNEDGRPYLWGQLYNFVLENPAEQSQFIDKYGDEIKEAGLELQFIENNAESFWISSNKVLSNLKTNIILYASLLLVAMLFTIYMYMEIYKGNYAIERILGVTYKSATRHLLIPLYAFGTLGVGLSSYIGYQIAIGNSKKILEEILGELPRNLDFSNNIKIILLIFLIIIVLLVVQSLLIVLRLKSLSLLELLSKGKKRKSQDLDIVNGKTHLNKEINTEDLTDAISFDHSNININKGKSVFKEYGKKHISRSIVTTLLIVLVTGLLTGTLIWLSNVIESNEIFIEKTISETTILGELEDIREVQFSDTGITEDILNKVLETDLVEDYFGFIKNEYDEINIDRYGVEETANKKDVLNLEHFERAPRMTLLSSNKKLNSNRGIKISGIEDQNVIDKIYSYNLEDDEIPILASTTAMETFDLEIGHKISLRDSSSPYPNVYGTIIATFKGYELPTYGSTNVKMAPMDSKNEIFIFPIDGVRLIEKTGIYYEEMNLLFDKDKNIELYNNREDILKQISKSEYGASTGYKLVLHDDILTETIEPLERNLELLSIIYPIILVLSLMISIALPYLLILRRSEELAIMRILGVKESEVKRYVFKESIFLVILGQVIAMVLISLVTYKSGVYPIWKYLFALAGYFLGSIIGMGASLKNVLDKKPLEMLQVKE